MKCKQFKVSERVLFFLVSIVFVSCQRQIAGSVIYEDLTVQLGDFETRAQLTYPKREGTFPCVLLVHPSGPFDMNLTVLGDDGKIKAQNFKVLAEHLSSNGFAVMRYNKRYVSNYADYNEEKYRTLRGPMLLADVKSVLDEMRAHPAIDSDRIFVYAASQGTRIVPTLAVSDPAIKGMILQGPVIHHFRTQHRAEFLPNVIIPYLREYCGADGIDVDCLVNAKNGSGGGMVRASLGFFADFETESTAVIDDELDLNSDGRIDFANEMQIALENIRSDTSRPYVLKTISELVSDVKTPLLILQGEADAFIAVEMVKSLVTALEQNGHEDHTLKLYPKLGHTLGYAETRVADDMNEIESEPLQDLTNWLRQRSQI